MNDIERARRAEQARAILESPVFIEAWETYRARCLDLIERADSNSTEQVMQAKRLLAAGAAARAHLAALITDGKIAVASMELEKQKSPFWKRG